MLPLKNTEERYGLIAILFHWGIAILVIFMLMLGIYMTNIPFNPETLMLYGRHKSLGALLLMLVVLRLLWRLTGKVPSLPENTPKWQNYAAHISHFMLYALIIAMPVSGWLMSSAAGFPVSVFGFFTLPDLVTPDKVLKEIFGEVHEVLSLLLMGLIVIHVLAAFEHHFLRKDNVLRRMLPW